MRLSIERPMSTHFVAHALAAVQEAEQQPRTEQLDAVRDALLRRLPGFTVGRGGSHVWVCQHWTDTRVLIVTEE